MELLGVIATLRSSQRMERLIIVQREDEALAEGTNGRYYSEAKGFPITKAIVC